ncbi:MAG: hypothetical protein ACM3MG_13965 [Bacillota bacterium]
MKWNLLSFVFVVFSASFSVAATPDCLVKSQVLPVINEQILAWKRQTKNGFKSRGHLEGTLTKIYPDKSGHVHIQVQIGQNYYETIEVIYNQRFGKVAPMQIGAKVEACGDYITAKAINGKYRASPDGAILHWVHESTRPGHESGYMMIDGVVYGDRDGDGFPQDLEVIQ